MSFSLLAPILKPPPISRRRVGTPVEPPPRSSLHPRITSFLSICYRLMAVVGPLGRYWVVLHRVVHNGRLENIFNFLSLTSLLSERLKGIRVVFRNLPRNFENFIFGNISCNRSKSLENSLARESGCIHTESSERLNGLGENRRWPCVETI